MLVVDRPLEVFDEHAFPGRATVTGVVVAHDASARGHEGIGDMPVTPDMFTIAVHEHRPASANRRPPRST